MELFYRALPFTLTDAQRRCVEEALADMRSGTPMNRLCQGDVGSGKTMVAAACVYFMVKNGRQAALLAPTEILAPQHYQGLALSLIHILRRRPIPAVRRASRASGVYLQALLPSARRPGGLLLLRLPRRGGGGGRF